MSAQSWQSAAVCRDVDPELFFPTAVRGAAYEAQVADAKQVCRRCPVRAQCLDFALAWVPDGVAGGLDADERRAVRTHGRHVPSPEAARLEIGLQPRASQQEIAEAGRVLLDAGRSRTEVATRCRVSVSTVDRWNARRRCATAPSGPGTSPAATGRQTCTTNRTPERSTD